MCKEDNLRTGGGVYRSDVWAWKAQGSQYHPVVHQPAPGEQPGPQTADGLRVDVDGELLERGRRHRRLEHHHGAVLQHLPGVRDSGGVCAGGGGCGYHIPRGSGGIGRGCQFVSPAPADQFPSGDPDTPCWDHGFKRLLIFFQPLTLKLFQSWLRWWVSTLTRVHLGTLPFPVGRRASLADVFVAPFIFYKAVGPVLPAATGPDAETHVTARGHSILLCWLSGSEEGSLAWCHLSSLTLSTQWDTMCLTSINPCAGENLAAHR